MEKTKSGVPWYVFVIFFLVIVSLVLAIIPLLGSSAAEDCLRGDQTACAYFQAQEEVDRIQQELDAAKEILATTRAEYNSSNSE